MFAIVIWVAAIMHLSKFVHAPKVLILLAVPCATADGVCKEILWRG